MFESKNTKPGTFSTLDAATVFKGEIFSKSRVEITGKFEGIIITNDLVIKEGGSVDGVVYCYNTVSIQAGTINGKIFAKTLILGQKSQVSGEMIYNQIEVSKGSLISATIKQVHESTLKQKIDDYVSSISKANTAQMEKQLQSGTEEKQPTKKK